VRIDKQQTKYHRKMFLYHMGCPWAPCPLRSNENISNAIKVEDETENDSVQGSIMVLDEDVEEEVKDERLHLRQTVSEDVMTEMSQK
jgi:hypothetical protein